MAAGGARVEDEQKAYERSRRTAFYTSIAAVVAVIVAMFARGYYDAAVSVAFLAGNGITIWAMRRAGARWWAAIGVPVAVTVVLYRSILYAGPNGEYHRCVDSLTSLPGGSDPVAKAAAESLCAGKG